MRIALEVSCQLIFADVDKLTFEVVWKDWAGQIEVLYDEWAICCTQVPETLDLEHRKESLRIPLCLHLINIFLHICQRIMPSDMTFYRTQVNPGSDLWVRMSVCPSVRHLWLDLTDVTLADEDTNSILTDNVNRAIEGNVAMQVLLVANFGSNASGASWWPNFEPMQVVPLGDPICNWCKWCLLVAKFAISANSSIWWPNCANNGWGIT